MRRNARLPCRALLVAVLAGPCASIAEAQDTQAAREAVANARRIGERQCEHALIMGRINTSQPGTPERTEAEAALEAVVERARRESKRDDEYRERRDRLSLSEQGIVETAYRFALGNCGKR